MNDIEFVKCDKDATHHRLTITPTRTTVKYLNGTTSINLKIIKNFVMYVMDELCNVENSFRSRINFYVNKENDSIRIGCSL